MILSDQLQAFIGSHLMQLTVATVLASMTVFAVGRRFPHFAFLVCMLAFAKSLVPPLVTSPAGFFTRIGALAYAPSTFPAISAELVELKQAGDQALSRTGSNEQTSEAAVAFTSSTEAWVWFDWTGCVLCMWGVGVAMVLGRSFWHFAKFRQVVSNSVDAPLRIQKLALQLREQAGLKRPIRVVISGHNQGPACFGYFRSNMVLPRAMLAWPDKLLGPVLAHELTHARRGDVVWGYLQFAAQVVWWFHPIVWWLGKQTHVLCERCCDEEVVARFRYSRGDYAESLVRVLALRHISGPIMVGSNLSPAQITTQRLERLMQRCNGNNRGTSMLAWTASTVMALLLFPGMHWSSAKASLETRQFEASIHDYIHDQLSRKDWAAAVDLLRPIVDADRSNGRAVFVLGYALHMQGRWDEAISYHRQAAGFKDLRPVALYNLACALSMKGHLEQALQKLSEAIDAGFQGSEKLSSDPDLKPLQQFEKFRILEQQCKKRAELAKLKKEFSSWVGTWEVLDRRGNLVGVHTIAEQSGESLLTEDWKRVEGQSGTNINYFNPRTGKWFQAWVDDHGSVLEYEGEFMDDAVHFEGFMYDSSGERFQSRMTYIPQSDGTIAQTIQNSIDGGNSWFEYFSGTFRRQSGTQVQDVEKTRRTPKLMGLRRVEHSIERL